MHNNESLWCQSYFEKYDNKYNLVRKSREPAVKTINSCCRLSDVPEGKSMNANLIYDELGNEVLCLTSLSLSIYIYIYIIKSNIILL